MGARGCIGRACAQGGRSFLTSGAAGGHVGRCSARSRADIVPKAGVPRSSGIRRTGAAGTYGRIRDNCGAESGRPPLLRMAACSLANDTGARGGASRATTGRSMSARGGARTTPPARAPRTLRRSGVMAGAAVLARKSRPLGCAAMMRCGPTGCAEVKTLRGTRVTAPGTSALTKRAFSCPSCTCAISAPLTIRVLVVFTSRTYRALAW